MSCLIVVDVQNDFCEGGVLGVKGSSEIIEGINQEVESGKYILVVFTLDWHPANHCSFAANHPGVEAFQSVINAETGKPQRVWPVHCLQGSLGAELHSGLKVPKDAVLIRKGTNPKAEGYSGFGDVGIEDTGLLDLLKEHKVQQVLVAGLALDYCVARTAIDAAKRGFMTTIFEDLSRSISKESSLRAVQELMQYGGHIANSH